MTRGEAIALGEAAVLLADRTMGTLIACEESEAVVRVTFVVPRQPAPNIIEDVAPNLRRIPYTKLIATSFGAIIEAP